MLDNLLPWEEMAMIAAKILMVALLIIAWRRHRAENRTVLVEEEITLDGKGPRPFYYELAHIALRDLAMSDPGRFLETVSGDGAHLFLHRIWNQVQIDVAPDEEIPTEPMQCNVHDLAEGRHLAVINMPAPERITEAFFVAAAVEPPARRLSILTRRRTCRYFTLELGESDEGEPLAIFCEWQRHKGGAVHQNYGPIQPAGGAFVQAIRSMIDN